MAIKFTKMHGIGNDYVYVNTFEETVADPVALAKVVSDRHFGIGSDGLILIGPSETADVRMRMFNADGSESEMCGNGVRCVAKYAYDHGIATQDVINVETQAGVKRIEITAENGKAVLARVDMGIPATTRGEIPMTGPADDTYIDGPVSILGQTFKMTCVNMGNPHAVIFVDDVAVVPLEKLGAALEQDELFPERTNVHVVQVVDRGEVIMRTWERGSGITLACGTGASAVCVAAALTNRTDRTILAHLPGGDLTLEWADDDHLFMTGSATEVFEGEWPE
jgi:diaminopimelate epimerase